jgi:hypothetical protein
VVWVGVELGELEAAEGTRAMASDELVHTRARASRTGPKGHASRGLLCTQRWRLGAPGVPAPLAGRPHK